MRPEDSRLCTGGTRHIESAPRVVALEQQRSNLVKTLRGLSWLRLREGLYPTVKVGEKLRTLGWKVLRRRMGRRLWKNPHLKDVARHQTLGFGFARAGSSRPRSPVPAWCSAPACPVCGRSCSELFTGLMLFASAIRAYGSPLANDARSSF